MANTFLRKISSNISTTLTSVGSYTVGANIGAVVVGLSISNTTPSQVFANVTINNGSTDYYIVRNATIPAEGTLITVGGDQKVILQTGDSVKVSASGNVDVIMSVMESESVGLTVDGGGGGGGGTTYSHLTGDWTDGFFYSEPGQNNISLNTSLAVLSFYDALDSTSPGTIFTVVYNDNSTDTLTQSGASSYFGAQLLVPVTGFGSGSIKSIKSITF